jgi:hypothetical protein
MKSFIKTVALSILTVGSLSLSVVPQSQAFTSQFKSTTPITNQTIYRPQPEVDLSQAQVSKGELVAFNWKNIKPVGKIMGKPIRGLIRGRITNPTNSENQQR